MSLGCSKPVIRAYWENKKRIVRESFHFHHLVDKDTFPRAVKNKRRGAHEPPLLSLSKLESYYLFPIIIINYATNYLNLSVLSLRAYQRA